MLTRHIYIIGMPGSGKSSLGRKVASLLHLPFSDIDTRITETMGCTVKEIFAQYGEEAFRTIETNMLIQITRERPHIVSTGGGLVLRENNRVIMKNSGVIVLIDRPLDMIKSDIKLDRRPLLAEKGIDALDPMYEERIGIYRSSADLVLQNDGDYYSGVNGLRQLLTQRFAI